MGSFLMMRKVCIYYRLAIWLNCFLVLLFLDNENEICFLSGVKTLLFEGERDHLIPSSSQALVESDMFVVAGRIIGHCFLNGGPRLNGLSPAITHVLFGGEPEMATITVSDCVDQDVRDVVQLVWRKIFFNFVY